MFGYVLTYKPNLYLKDFHLYNSIYCGLCKSLNKNFGVASRFTLNYDITFLSLFYHNLSGIDFEINRERCLANVFVRKLTAKGGELTKTLAALNVILVYYKIIDDINDGSGSRGRKLIFNRAYKKAKKKYPALDEIVKKNYEAQVKEEKNKSCLDALCEPFANMFTEISREILKEKADNNVLDLCYFVGKWIYLADALDDFDKDIKEKQFNAFKIEYTNIGDKKTLLNDKKEDLEFLFFSVLKKISENLNNIKFHFNRDLIDNILKQGLYEKTKLLLAGDNRTCRMNTIKY